MNLRENKIQYFWIYYFLITINKDSVNSIKLLIETMEQQNYNNFRIVIFKWIKCIDLHIYY